ncbi:MAG: hypothetical protein AVO35_10380 [Candidatus Aegiribacteria sp. MLS_C]|nr:MAG: hypothetical protein AVO35_10380 [Candidatus Aegiribacteria sp. MLS_C]
MDAFGLRERLVSEYARYIRSFIRIRDQRISDKVEQTISEGLLWPDPLVQINPMFESGGSIEELVKEDLLHPECQNIFAFDKDTMPTPLRLYQHQVDAIRAARESANYVLTTGTGSGKSLAYIIPIVDHVLRSESRKRSISAVIVYPLNALANSQEKELQKFINEGYPDDRGPVTFARYTGQESEEEKAAICADPPDILLTNYVMLELILTRPAEEPLVRAASDLRFLVLDELHTYRGRQGADVALLVRRAKEYFSSPNVQMIGTSATLAGPGTLQAQKEEVAAVASRLFGSEVHAEHVIGETLQRITPEIDFKAQNEVQKLRSTIEGGSGLPNSFEQLRNHPLASWLETQFGVTRLDDNRLIRATPTPITGEKGAASVLSACTGLDAGVCAEAIIDGLETGSHCTPNPATGHPPFAYRVHQFISPSETVFATLQPPQHRKITLSGQFYAPDDPDQVLLPLVFCRECGQEYYCVAKRHIEDGEASFEKRDIYDRITGEEDRSAGYLYQSDEKPWPEAEDEVISRLPEDWVEIKDGVARIPRSRRHWLPKLYTIDEQGYLSDDGTQFAFIPAPFRFCPNCGVAYAPQQRSDFSKLASLGTEGRSTATTLLSIFTVLSLMDDDQLPNPAKKLLSFTDNRQDASLQAGHFNDFVEMGILRAGIYEAAKRAGQQGLNYEHLAESVFDALDLPFEAYALDPDVRHQARQDVESAFKAVLGYYIYRDLKRGWRVNVPNLEQCGLLEIGYAYLKDVCEDQELWDSCHTTLSEAKPDTREYVAKTLLDYMRRELCINVRYLDKGQQDTIRQRSGQHLRPPWALDDEDTLTFAAILFPRPRSRREDYSANVFLSSRSAFGRHLRLHSTFPDYNHKLSLDDTDIIIRDLLKVLRRGGLVGRFSEPPRGSDVPGYQVKASAILWKAGDGKSGFRDPIRVPETSEDQSAPNDFFRYFYSEIAKRVLTLRAKEHTAQVSSDERERREIEFRSADLPVMFCSPTMELGVDIAELNVVSLRNVPPSPANYAQRSGRAGRSGQPALVFAYCGKGSPHDQYFFRRPELMVSGAVFPPQVDLCNEELIRSHLHSIWLKETGQRLGSSLKEVLDVEGDDPSLDLLGSVRDSLENPRAVDRAMKRSTSILSDIQPDLHNTYWYSDGWTRKELLHSLDAFVSATSRWKHLFKSARSQLDLQNKIMKNASRSTKDKERAKRLHGQAYRQLELLLNDSARGQSDFYSYRYFASEGFLPGYNFPRLPLSAYIPGRRRRKDQDEYISRPRFLAISEFGPRAILYHEGAKYEVDRVIFMVEGEKIAVGSAKVCSNCGYFHELADEAGPDLCEACGAELGRPFERLLRLQNVSTRRRERISADEEERVRYGYDLASAYRFEVRDGRPSYRQARIEHEGNDLATLTFGQAARIWRLNLGWKRRRDQGQLGFVLDIDQGKWQRNEAIVDDQDDPLSNNTQRVLPYVEDNKNCILFKPSTELELETMLSLQTALKNAIQFTFQIEDSELAADTLPTGDSPSQILFYESAEGGAGVLSRLFEDRTAYRDVLMKALEICHFDPDTGVDLKHSPHADEDCGKACYDCLLSYGNQRYHQHLDRFLVRDLLLKLRDASLVPIETNGRGEDHLDRLLHLAGSDLEREWLRFISDNGLCLPTHAQKLIAECATRPDFLYEDKYTVIYVDGPVHEYPEREKRDGEQQACLENMGYTILRFAYKDGWMGIAQRYPSVFGITNII